jgi:hypothetical protein
MCGIYAIFSAPSQKPFSELARLVFGEISGLSAKLNNSLSIEAWSDSASLATSLMCPLIY